MAEKQSDSDTDFEDEPFDQSPRAEPLPPPAEKTQPEEAKKSPAEAPRPLEKLVYVEQEVKSILSHTEPVGDYSLEPDYRLGWRPNTDFEGAPIPMRFDYEDSRIWTALEGREKDVIYYGFRPQDSLSMHEAFAKKNAYPFKFPSKSVYMLIDITRQCVAPKPKSKQQKPRPVGTVPGQSLTAPIFDSFFEAGNLDLAVKVKDNEYDLYMRTDSNARGHHQWFFFSVQNRTVSTIHFNILNFTKGNSLYEQGMRVALFSEKKAEKAAKGELPGLYKGWHRGCDNIVYKVSRLTQELYQKARISLSFDYTFEYPGDKVWFAYNEPYTYSQLMGTIEQFKAEQAKLPAAERFFAQEVLCRSLTGLEVPLLTVTSGLATPREKIAADPSSALLEEVAHPEDEDWTADWATEFKLEARKRLNSEEKRVLIITARIHPGETCGSHMMHGFLKFVMSGDPVAVELRSKLIIKVVPMMNPDGVIVGNYRGCVTGQDLNRKFAAPDARLHPTICAVKRLVADLKREGKVVFGYIDLHGHSKKKCVFIYGPYYPLHMDRYVRVRILAKLLADRTQMFRYPACKFNQEPSKMNAARLVISREFDVMNSLTVEASFYGFLNADRRTIEFCCEFYERMGCHLGRSFLEYVHLLEEEKLQRVRRQFENRKRRETIAKGKSRHKKDSDVGAKKSADSTGKKELPREPAKMLEEEGPSLQPQQAQNPNEPGERRIIRLEECYQHPELFSDEGELKSHKLCDICQSIKEDIKREDLDAEDAGSDSSSSSSECDMLTGEEEAAVVKKILEAIQGCSPIPEPQGHENRPGTSQPEKSRSPASKSKSPQRPGAKPKLESPPRPSTSKPGHRGFHCRSTVSRTSNVSPTPNKEPTGDLKIKGNRNVIRFPESHGVGTRQKFIEHYMNCVQSKGRKHVSTSHFLEEPPPLQDSPLIITKFSNIAGRRKLVSRHQIVLNHYGNPKKSRSQCPEENSPAAIDRFENFSVDLEEESSASPPRPSPPRMQGAAKSSFSRYATESMGTAFFPGPVAPPLQANGLLKVLYVSGVAAKAGCHSKKLSYDSSVSHKQAWDEATSFTDAMNISSYGGNSCQFSSRKRGDLDNPAPGWCTATGSKRAHRRHISYTSGSRPTIVPQQQQIQPPQTSHDWNNASPVTLVAARFKQRSIHRADTVMSAEESATEDPGESRRPESTVARYKRHSVFAKHGSKVHTIYDKSVWS